MTPFLLSLGSSLGNRRYHLRRAVDALAAAVTLGRLSSVWETEPIQSPSGSPSFLNLVVAGLTSATADDLLRLAQSIELRLGRRRTVRNAPRVIDIDLVLFGALATVTPWLTLPHPRYREREFVLAPLRELGLSWVDPVTGKRIGEQRGEGDVQRVGPLY